MARSTAQGSNSGIIPWLRLNLFHTWFSALQTVVVLAALVWLVDHAFTWLVLEADWIAEERRGCPGEGACWPILTNNVHLILIGFYPIDQAWRAYLSLAILLACPFLIVRWFHLAWSRAWFIALVCGSAVLLWLLFGGFGLEPVKFIRIGGLLLTLFASVLALAIAVPGGVCLALSRRSRLPTIKMLTIGFRWFFGSVPTIILFFSSSIMLPLFLPPADLPYSIFPAPVLLVFGAIAAVAFSAPILDSLDAVPKSQRDVSRSLGLSSWTITRRVKVPQALLARTTVMVDVIVWVFLESSVLMIIGLYELYQVGLSRITDPQWIGEAASVSMIIGAIYLLIGLSIRHYGRHVERANSAQTEQRPMTARLPIQGGPEL